MVCRRQVEARTIAVPEGEQTGAKVAGLCRKHGMSDATYYNRKARYARLTVSELKRLNALEEENRRLKQTVADQAVNITTLAEGLQGGQTA